jgi:sirohydrochlorin ferrochelatase
VTTVAEQEPALLLIGHGSRSAAGVDQYWVLADVVRRLRPRLTMGCGFIELARPDLDEAIDHLVEGGMTSVIAVPLVLLGAGHLKSDGPAALSRGRARHPGVDFTYARDLAIHPAVLSLAEERIRAAWGPARGGEAASDPRPAAGLGSPPDGGGRGWGSARGGEAASDPRPAAGLGSPPDGGGRGWGSARGGEPASDPRPAAGLGSPPDGGGRGWGSARGGEAASDRAVVLVGRGSSDPDANADLYKVGRLLDDSRGLGMVEPAFVSLARPSVTDALDRCRRLGATTVAVVPYFLFTGLLVDRIERQARAWAESHPDVEIAVGRELGPDERVGRLVLERYDEASTGGAVMNCDCCIYRTALPGYEHRVGAPTAGATHTH